MRASRKHLIMNKINCARRIHIYSFNACVPCRAHTQLVDFAHDEYVSKVAENVQEACKLWRPALNMSAKWATSRFSESANSGSKSEGFCQKVRGWDSNPLQSGDITQSPFLAFSSACHIHAHKGPSSLSRLAVNLY